MKKLKSIINQIKTFDTGNADELNDLVWQLICYSPKMPVRLQQQQLLDEAEKFSLTVADPHFAHKELNFNGFIWGKGKHQILITHGWGSKAADFFDVITVLKELPNVQIIAFDAPGNGSSEGELSNLLLYTQAVKAILINYGKPAAMIGHSLGGAANVIALREMGMVPSLLISLTPLILLKENFEASMNAAGVPQQAQAHFFKSFETRFNLPASYFDLNAWYLFDEPLNHWLAYDEHDLISPYSYMNRFLDAQPSIKAQNFNGVGHDRILKSPEVIEVLVRLVKEIAG